MATILEHAEISPPADAAPELSLPLTFLDMLWYEFPASQSLLFFDFPCSKSHFLDNLVPDLKTSLSLTLAHFLPLAGNIIHPLNPDTKPTLHYVSGNTVSFTVSISASTADFRQLTADHPRDSDQFYAFAPNIPPATRSENRVSCPVLALQVTLFPGTGLCVGFVTHHAVADASTVVSFMQAWALINTNFRSASDTRILLQERNLLPFYDRTTLRNINNLDSLYWDEIVELSSSVEPRPQKFPTNKLRATYTLKKDHLQKMKNHLAPNGIAHLSSFMIICGLFWACSAKAAALSGEEVNDEESEYFGFVVDCRGRLNPPLPVNYLGNCVALASAELKHGTIKGGDGFVRAVKAIGEAIKEMVHSGKDVVGEAANWSEEYGKRVGKRQYGVAGSPRFHFYGVDYGWGKPKKFEALFIDEGRSICLCKSGEFEDGVEIGLSMGREEMCAFQAVFSQFIADLLE